MNKHGSLLNELRAEYEAGREPAGRQADVEGFQTEIVTVVLINVDRLERVALEFASTAIEEPVLEDLVRLMLGRDSAFLRRGRLAGLHPNARS